MLLFFYYEASQMLRLFVFFFRLEIKGMSFIMSFMKILFFILLYIIVLWFVSNPAAVPFKDFKRTKEVQKPQVIWLSGFFIVQRNPVKYSGIQSKVCLLV